MEAMTWTPLEDETELADALYALLHTCAQSQQLYAAASRSAPSAEFTMLFGKLATERDVAVQALQEMLLLRGGLALERGGSALSELSQIASLGCTNGEAQTDTLLSRQALLEACERQEQHTLEQYERVLQMNLPTDVATLVRQQHSQVAAALRSIGAWKPF